MIEFKLLPQRHREKMNSLDQFLFFDGLNMCSVYSKFRDLKIKSLCLCGELNYVRYHSLVIVSGK